MLCIRVYRRLVKGSAIFCKNIFTEYDDGHIVCDPQICSGAPTIRGTRITVHVIVGMMAGGQTEADVLAAYPELLPTDVSAALAYDQRRHP